MTAVIFLVMTIGLLWLIYWSVVRQSMLDSIEDDVATLRNFILWQIIDEAEGARSRSAQRLLEEVEANKFVCWISFSQIVLHLVQNKAKIKADAAQEAELFGSSPKWIRDAWHANGRLTIKAALANSPIWWPPLALILLGGIFSMSALNWWNDAGNSASQLRAAHFGVRQTA